MFKLAIQEAILGITETVAANKSRSPYLNYRDYWNEQFEKHFFHRDCWSEEFGTYCSCILPLQKQIGSRLLRQVRDNVLVANSLFKPALQSFNLLRGAEALLPLYKSFPRNYFARYQESRKAVVN